MASCQQKHFICTIPFWLLHIPKSFSVPKFLRTPTSSYTTLEVTVEAASVEKRLVFQPLLIPMLGAHSPAPAQQGGSSANGPQSSFLIYPNECFQLRVERWFSETLFESWWINRWGKCIWYSNDMAASLLQRVGPENPADSSFPLSISPHSGRLWLPREIKARQVEDAGLSTWSAGSVCGRKAFSQEEIVPSHCTITFSITSHCVFCKNTFRVHLRQKLLLLGRKKRSVKFKPSGICSRLLGNDVPWYIIHDRLQAWPTSDKRSYILE